MCIKIGFFYDYQPDHWHGLPWIKKSCVLLAYCILCQPFFCGWIRNRLINPFHIKTDVNNLKLVVMQSVS
jgi:hypothetical protein